LHGGGSACVPRLPLNAVNDHGEAVALADRQVAVEPGKAIDEAALPRSELPRPVLAEPNTSPMLPLLLGCICSAPGVDVERRDRAPRGAARIFASARKAVPAPGQLLLVHAGLGGRDR